MAKNKNKKKKHNPNNDGNELIPRPFNFLDGCNFIWSGYEWQIEHLGPSWLRILFNHVHKFVFDLYDDYGLFPGWLTIQHAERQIIKSLNYQDVFSNDTKPAHFLRFWIDNWVELQYCRIWCHIYDTLRLENGIREFDAVKRADELAGQFEAFYEPTFPRVKGLKA
jgi:hypothetical protein